MTNPTQRLLDTFRKLGINISQEQFNTYIQPQPALLPILMDAWTDTPTLQHDSWRSLSPSQRAHIAFATAGYLTATHVSRETKGGSR